MYDCICSLSEIHFQRELKRDPVSLDFLYPFLMMPLTLQLQWLPCCTPGRVAGHQRPANFAWFLDQHGRCCGHAFINIYFRGINLEWCETEMRSGLCLKWPFLLSHYFNANKIGIMVPVLYKSVMNIQLSTLFSKFFQALNFNLFMSRCHQIYIYFSMQKSF
jgi:hypothetical protein